MTDVLATLTQQELALLAPALNTFFTAMQDPNVNFVSVIDAAKNLQLSALQVTGPAQSVLIHFIFSALQAKLNSLITPAA